MIETVLYFIWQSSLQLSFFSPLLPPACEQESRKEKLAVFE